MLSAAINVGNGGKVRKFVLSFDVIVILFSGKSDALLTEYNSPKIDFS